MKKYNHNHGPIARETLDGIIRDPAARRKVVQECHYWFLHVYLASHIRYPMAKFQKELIELTEGDSKAMVVEAFRGSGKTTIMGMSYAIWSILGIQQKKFVLILAQTETQARQHLANIKKELESNDLLKMDLGPFEEPDDEWRATSLVLREYGARITVASIEKPIRGIKHRQYRPDLIICDDLEDMDSVRTQESRDKAFNWLTGDVIPLGDKDTRLVVIGTRLHEDSIIMRLRRAILEGRMDGVARSYPFFDENDKVRWPEKYPAESDIETLKGSLPSTQAWNREYLLTITSPDEQAVRPEYIRYYDSLPAENVENAFRYAAVGIDPAISEKETADYTAIVSAKVYGRKKNLKIYLLPRPINERMNFPTALERIKLLSETIGGGVYPAIWIEGVAYQQALIQQLRAEGYPAREYRPEGTDKLARLHLAARLMESGQVLFPRKGAEQLIAQTIGFGSERHDDLMDAFCMLVLSISKQETRLPEGYESLISESELASAFVDSAPLEGEKRLGVALAGPHRSCSAVVLRCDNAARVLYHEPVTDVDIIASKVVELAREHGIPLSYKQIFIDASGNGWDLCEKVKDCALQSGRPVERHLQHYGIKTEDPPWYDRDICLNQRSLGYRRVVRWIKSGSKLLGRHMFDELLNISYTEQSGGKMRIIDKERLSEQGVDASVPDALALTMILDGPPKPAAPTRTYREIEIDERTGYFRF